GQLAATQKPATTEENVMILDSFNLEGKVAIVTGCDTGLGQGMALGLAKAGCDIVGVNIVEPTETIAKMAETGRKFVDIRANLMVLDDIPSIIDRAVTELGR